MVPIPNPSILDPANIVIHTIQWIRDHIPALAQSLGLGTLKLIVKNVLKKITKKHYRDKILDSPDPGKRLNAEELNEIVNLVKEEIIVELQRRQISIEEEEIVSEIYRAIIYLIQFQVITLEKVARNREDIQQVLNYLEKVQLELIAHNEFIQMLFDGDIEINNLLLQTREEVQELVNAFEELKSNVIEQKGEWHNAIENLRRRISSIHEEILNELWNRFLAYQLRLNPPKAVTKALSYFGQNFMWILFMNRETGTIIYFYATPLATESELKDIIESLKSRNELIPPLLLAFNAHMNELVLGDIQYLETENAKVCFSPICETYGLVVGFKPTTNTETLRFIVGVLSERIKTEILPRFLPNENFDSVFSADRNEAINKIVEEFMYNIELQEDTTEFYKNNIDTFIELIPDEITSTYVRVKVKIKDVPSNVHKVTLYFDTPVSIVSESERYRISPPMLEFQGLKELYVRISRLNNLPITNDKIAIPIQTQINDEQKLTPVFQKELEVSILKPGKIALAPRAWSAYTLHDIKEDGKIVTDRPIQLKIKNIGDEEIVLTSKILEIEDYTEPNSLTNIFATPIGIIGIERIIPEPISLKPAQEISVELRLRVLKEIQTFKLLILKIYSIMAEKNFNVIYLYLKQNTN